MRDNFNLAPDIARTYRIARGTTEKESAWLARVIYSFIGQSALSSLWDLHEDELPTSIERFKERITITKESCVDLYPEIAPFFLDDSWGNSESIAEEIYSIYLNTGYCYKSPRRLSPVIRRAASGERCTLLRGNAVGESSCVSGLGAYCLKSKEQGTISIPDMFQLCDVTLDEVWKHIVFNRKWEVSEADQLEFLRLTPPFSQGYWHNKVDSANDISLARTTKDGERIYFLYKVEDGHLLLSQLPDWITKSPEWMTDIGAYRNLSNACLHHYGNLPSTRFQSDGQIVHLQIQYLFPPAEQNLIRLYSWPDFESHQYSFRRVMDSDAFFDIKTTLESIGYEFEGA